MKKLLRIVLIVFGLLALIVAGLVIYNIVAPLPTYKPGNVEFTVNVTPAQLHRGQLFLTECAQCHAGPGGALVGRKLPEMSSLGEIYSMNITHDKEEGIGAWTDGQLAYALRTGITPTGRFLVPPMPHWNRISDEDLQCVIAALRSDLPYVKPAKTHHPTTKLNFMGKFLCRVAFKPLKFPDHKIERPDTSDMMAFGKYLVTCVYDCYQCHSHDISEVNFYFPTKTPGYLGGGNVMQTEDGRKIITPNITFDETGIKGYTVNELGMAIRYGKAKDNRELMIPMPKFTTLSDHEVQAIYTYLQSVPKINHKIQKGPIGESEAGISE